MNKNAPRHQDAPKYRTVMVDIPGPEPVRIEITPRHYDSLARKAARERTTVAELLRPTAIAAVADRLAHPTDTAARPVADDHDTPPNVR